LEDDLAKKQQIKSAKKHYENFPVASFLIPKKIRRDIAIVYWFARTADDLADEGDIDDKVRLGNLNNFENELLGSLQNQNEYEYFSLLKETINRRKLTLQYFLDLLSAFKQDVVKKKYNNFLEVEDYCKRSANPIGRIILELNNIRHEEVIKLSDKICTALQLTNFYQDTIIDYKNNRIYYPLDELGMFSVTEKMFELQENNSHISALVKHNVDRSQVLFDEGKKILDFLSGRLKIEIKWTIAGGERILSKIRKNNYDVFSNRPKLSKIDFVTLLLRSIF
jgi:squalene synthase HpnC